MKSSLFVILKKFRRMHFPIIPVSLYALLIGSKFWLSTLSSEMDVKSQTDVDVHLNSIMSFPTLKTTNTNHIQICLLILGQWLWYIWQRHRFQFQRTRVRIQSLATFIKQLFTVTVWGKEENKEKEAGNGSFLKKTFKFNNKCWRAGAPV